MTVTTIPLFPLPTVLFPGGFLPLRIFEQRYIDMVRECSVKSCRFGVCLLDSSEDAKQPATHLRIGTTADICDFSTLQDGLLGITAVGMQKFVIQKTRVRDNGLLMAEVETLTEAMQTEIPVQYSILSIIVGRFMDKMGKQYPSFQSDHLQDASWVGYRLAELLPFENHEKQVLLQIDDPLERLQLLLDIIPRFQEPGPN